MTTHLLNREQALALKALTTCTKLDKFNGVKLPLECVTFNGHGAWACDTRVLARIDELTHDGQVLVRLDELKRALTPNVKRGEYVKLEVSAERVEVSRYAGLGHRVESADDLPAQADSVAVIQAQDAQPPNYVKLWPEDTHERQVGAFDPVRLGRALTFAEAMTHGATNTPVVMYATDALKPIQVTISNKTVAIVMPMRTDGLRVPVRDEQAEAVAA